MSRSAGHRSSDPSLSLSRLSTLFPQTIDLSLDRVSRLLSALRNPQRRLPPVIHVAGTNGKGSTIAFIRSILEASGRKVHVYTSPHLVKFNERIRIAGDLVSDAELMDLLNEIELANAGRPITFFEATTAAAFLAFSRYKADFTILETGMGGRLDATNVVPNPLVTAITPISWDHSSYLGPTISQIAREKAGIFRKGVPAAIGPQRKDATKALRAAAKAISAPVFEHGRGWNVEAKDNRLFFNGSQQLILPRPLLAGDHQLDNAGLALAILGLIPDIGLKSSDYIRGILNANWPARLMPLPHSLFEDLLPRDIEIFLDGGHNEGASHALAAWAEGSKYELDVIVGMLNTRDPREFLAPLSPYISRLRSVPILGNESSHSATTLAASAREIGVADARPASSVLAAIAGLSRAPAPRRILVCGSLHLAGRFLSDLAQPIH